MPTEYLDLSSPRRVHVVGIGGAGMSGLARLLASLGHHVAGSDLVDSPTSSSLRAAGIAVAVGHSAKNVGAADLVTWSPAVAPDNPELVEASARGIELATRAHVLGALCRLREVLAVAGTHGKTTTSSMLALILQVDGRSPSWLLGADVAGLGANAGLGQGPELVLEADESYGTMAELLPALCALTSVEPDHLDHYGTFDALEAAFAALLGRATERVCWGDDPVAAELGRQFGATLVGTHADCDAVVRDVVLERATARFTLTDRGERLELRVGAPGRHNVANAAVAAVCALRRGAAPESVTNALSRFAGVPRRFEFRGEFGGATMVDDYAHLPGEVAAVVAAARAGAWRRIVAVFQPHRYTRTAKLAGSFAGAFDGVDVLFVTGVYAAGEAPLPGVSGRLVADAVAAGPHAPDVRYVPDRRALRDAVAAELRDGDLLLTLGAGDLTALPDELRAAS